MWTTWNSRAEWRPARLAAVGLVLVACASGSRSGDAPDSPRPPRDMTGLTQPPVAVDPQRVQEGPVEIRTLRLRRVRGDTMLTRLAGPELMNRAPDPIAIEITTAEPLGDVQRTSSAEIYLDLARVGDTWPFAPDRLIAFVPSVERLRAGTSVTVAWLGSEERTRSRRPVVLTEEHLRGVR